MDHVDSFSDCKKAQFAFFKPLTCAMQNEHSAFRKYNSKMVLFCMHKSIVGLAIIKLATPQACKQCRVASHSARLLRSNVGRMQTILPKCNSQIATKLEVNKLAKQPQHVTYFYTYRRTRTYVYMHTYFTAKASVATYTNYTN